MRKSVVWVDRITKILPGGIIDKVARMVGSKMDGPDESDHGSQAALYGISASFENRRNVKQLVENLLDGMY